VKGDSKVPAIMAASIIAKVTRDRLMDQLALEFPLYGFERHRGYPTPDHLAALGEHGPSDVHRRSFRPVRVLLEAANVR
jgi:ribonuclease HII